MDRNMPHSNLPAKEGSARPTPDYSDKSALVLTDASGDANLASLTGA